MQIGLKVWGMARTRETLKAVAEAADAAGVHSLWISETVSVDREQTRPYGPGLDPWTMYAFLAACTERVKLGSGVVIGPLVHPLLMNSIVSSIDHLSGGRAIVGIGIGHRSEDYDAMGLDFAKRGGMARDQVAALRWLWTNPAGGHFESEHYAFKALDVLQPLTPGGPPIYLSGKAPHAVRRAALQADGFVFSAGWSPEDIRHVRSEIPRLREAHGIAAPFQYWFQIAGFRATPAEIEADVARFEELGADGIIYQDPLHPLATAEALAKVGPGRAYLGG